MKIQVKGKKGRVNEFIVTLQNEGRLSINSINKPECYRFCDDSDFVIVSVTSFAEYIDFNILKKRAFRYLDISVVADKWKCSKAVNSQNVVYVSLTPVKVSNVSEKTGDYVIPEMDVSLGDYETLELFESRVGN